VVVSESLGFCRPQRYSEAATRTTVINDPITIPMMTPPERLDPEVLGEIEDVELAVAAVAAAVRDF
jgi:hypothetical protein